MHAGVDLAPQVHTHVHRVGQLSKWVSGGSHVSHYLERGSDEQGEGAGMIHVATDYSWRRQYELCLA